MEVTARVSCRPTPKGNSKRVLPDRRSDRCGICARYAKHFAVPRPGDKKAEKALVKLLLPSKPATPLSGPVCVDIAIVHQAPKSWPQYRQRAADAGVIRPSSRGTPDIGNLEKMVCDALEKAGWLNDDAQVVEQRIAACYGQNPGYYVRLYSLEGRCSPDALREDIPALPARARVYFSPSDSELTPAG